MKIRNRKHRGLSIAEVLISMTITALLLTAIATAFASSSSAVEMNDRFFRASQAGRVSMLQLLGVVRRCQAVTVPNSKTIQVITDDNRNLAYYYSSTTGQLTMQDNTLGGTYILARNLRNVTFSADSAPDPKTHIVRVTRVAVSLDVQFGTNEVLLSGSAAPRRAIVY